MSSVYVLPDLDSYYHFPVNSSEDTIISSDNLDERSHRKTQGLLHGRFSSYWYTTTDDEHLRVCSDIASLLSYLDDVSAGIKPWDFEVLSDSIMNAVWFPDEDRLTADNERPDEEPTAAKIARETWARFAVDAKPGVQHRFKEHLQMHLQALHELARIRETGILPSLDAYINLRRGSSGYELLFDLTEYIIGIELPEDFLEDAVILAIRRGANDLVTWSHDIFDLGQWPRNLVTIVMTHEGLLHAQEGIDRLAEMCRKTIDTVRDNLKRVSSFGNEDIDKDVANYIKRLQDWVVGSLMWNFVPEKYFTERLESEREKEQELARL